MPNNPITWPEVCAVLALWQQQQLPGTVTVMVTLHLGSGETVPLPFVAGADLPTLDHAAGPEEPQEPEPFLPKHYQRRILAALDGVALHKLPLAAEVGDRLYKPNGIRELMEHQMVRKDERYGYYRPDRPPPELANQESEGIVKRLL